MALAEICFNVRGETVAATLEMNMRPRTRQRQVICQELALGLAEFPLFLWLRNICAALPHNGFRVMEKGSTNVVRDSCFFSEKATPVFPPVLEAAYCRTNTDRVMPARDLKFSLHHRNTHV